jgi:hypothetical protein
MWIRSAKLSLAAMARLMAPHPTLSMAKKTTPALAAVTRPFLVAAQPSKTAVRYT